MGRRWNDNLQNELNAIISQRYVYIYCKIAHLILIWIFDRSYYLTSIITMVGARVIIKKEMQQWRNHRNLSKYLPGYWLYGLPWFHLSYWLFIYLIYYCFCIWGVNFKLNNKHYKIYSFKDKQKNVLWKL